METHRRQIARERLGIHQICTTILGYLNREQDDPASPEMGGGYGEKDKDSVAKYVRLSAAKKIVPIGDRLKSRILQKQS